MTLARSLIVHSNAYARVVTDGDGVTRSIQLGTYLE
jgi:hypothetical protein